MRTAIALTVATTLFATARGPAEEVEHPTFTSWARHPVGTEVVIRAVTTKNGKPTTTTTITSRLLELKRDLVVIETRRVSDATGSVVASAPERYQQPKMFPLLNGMKKEQIGKPLGAVAQGEETLKLAGREIKTIWFDTKGRGDAGPTLIRTWLSDDIPGRLVKGVTKIPKTSTTITRELVEVKIP